MPRYVPIPISNPNDIEVRDLVQYLQGELQKVSDSFKLGAEGRVDVLSVTPNKPRTGQLVYADGITWNPGAGAGYYTYNGTSWVFLSGDFPLVNRIPLVNVTVAAGKGVYFPYSLELGATITLELAADGVAEIG